MPPTPTPPAPPTRKPPTPITTQQLLVGDTREFILLAGKDGSGKTCALVSMASYLELVLDPNATFFVIDTEMKFKSALRSFGGDAPENLVYYACETMNDVTEALHAIVLRHKPGDWIGIESAGRIWEKAQDMGYQAIVGLDKPAYMERRREHSIQNPGVKPMPVTPKPDDLWSIIKGAHDGAFMDVLTNLQTLNVILTTAIARPPKDRANRQESPDRKDARAEFGIDSNIEGAPRLPYFMETMCMMGMRGNMGTCRVVRDNNSTREDPHADFDVPGRKAWAPSFWEQCRLPETAR